MSVTEAITALTAIGALVFTGLSLNATRDQVAAVQQQNKVSEQGQFTDRYTKAVEQLDRTGQEHLQARLGAIYALERLAHDSPRDQPTIIEILSAFIRSNRSTSASVPTADPTCPAPQPLTVDAQAALTVLGRRNSAHDNGANTSLNNVCLNGANLRDVDLSRAFLNGANLRDVFLGGADLRDAFLRDAYLFGTDLRGADLRGADLRGAELDTTFVTMPLGGADSGFAFQGGRDLQGVDLRGTDLRGMDLRGADLRGANLGGANLGDVDLRGAMHDSMTIVDGVSTDSSTVGMWW